MTNADALRLARARWGDRAFANAEDGLCIVGYVTPDGDNLTAHWAGYGWQQACERAGLCQPVAGVTAEDIANLRATCDTIEENISYMGGTPFRTPLRDLLDKLAPPSS